MKKIYFLKFLTIMSVIPLCSCSSELTVDEFYESSPYNKYIVGYRRDESGNKYYGALDYKGNVIADFNKKYISVGDNGIISIIEENSAYLLKDGQRIDTSFKSISGFYDGTSLVQTKDNLYGVIDESLNYLVEPIFTNCQMGANGVYFLSKDDENYFLYKDNYTKIDGSFSKYCNILDEQYAVCVTYKDGNYGVINNYGEIVVEPKYQSISLIKDVALCITNETKTLINLKTKEELISIPNTFHNIILAKSSSYYVATIDKVTSIYNKNKKIKSLPQNELAYELYNELLVTINFGDSTTYNIYNKKGVKLTRDTITTTPFITEDGEKVVIMNENNVFKVINSKGKKLFTLENSKIVNVEGNNIIKFKNDDIYYVADIKGNILCELDSINYHIYSGPFGFTVEDSQTNDSTYYDMKGNQLISSSNKLEIQYNFISESYESGTNLYNFLGEKIYSSSYTLYF
ncbi:MAG: WG repeat-containing protein [Bacilli bacterium]